MNNEELLSRRLVGMSHQQVDVWSIGPLSMANQAKLDTLDFFVVY
jgi:hypothetical protein